MLQRSYSRYSRSTRDDAETSSPAASRRRREPLFVAGVPVGVEQADRGGGGAGRADVRDDARDLVVVERDQRLPVRGEPLADADGERGIDERPSILLHQVVERAPRLPADADDVLEAGGGDERHAGPAALEHGVGRDRRPVHDVEAGAGGGDVGDARDDRARRIVGRRADLVDRDALGTEAHQVGERATGVDADSDHGRADTGPGALVADQPEPVMRSPFTRPA